MTTILCYGDSNTYGYNPVNGLRYPREVRWTGVLQRILADEYMVIEEGCNGRTTVFEDAAEPWKVGLSYLKPCLNTHKPIDFVIMMLGSNDLKRMFHASPEEIADGAEKLVCIMKEFTKEKQGFVPKIILVSPPEIGEGIATSEFARSFDEDAIARSKKLPALYEQIAKEYECIFFDAAKVAEASKVDSLHLMPEAHRKLAEALCDCIKKNQ